MSQYIPVMEKTNSLLKLHNRCPFTGVKRLGVRPPLRGQGHLKIKVVDTPLKSLTLRAILTEHRYFLTVHTCL